VYVNTTTWVISMIAVVAVLAFDLQRIVRHPHVPSAKENWLALAIYSGAAGLFGVWIAIAYENQYAIQFFSGWLTEKSLSVDNLFVFLLIMARFGVPRQYQQSALLVGIVLALVLRTGFILVGAAAINAFSWVFYLFGAFLLWTAWKVGRQKHEEGEEYHRPRVVKMVHRVMPSTDRYHGTRLIAKEGGRWLATPMLVVLIAIGLTDVMFAVDSVPAIFGITQEPYLVLMANAFALMGLRQLYFLLGDLLNRLVYLNAGLGVLLGFIGMKLFFHALKENELPFINGGHPVAWAPDLPSWLSLTVIVTILGVTVAASLWHDRRTARSTASGTPEP